MRKSINEAIVSTVSDMIGAEMKGSFTQKELHKLGIEVKNVSVDAEYIQLEENREKYDEEVLKYTYPIFVKEFKDDKPELVATSIVIYLEGAFYLVTAAHVYKNHIEKKESFSIGLKETKEIISFNGTFFSSTDDKVFDIGFIELDKEFIETNKMTAFHLHDESIADSNTEKYFGMLCGYPTSANMNHSKKAFWKDPKNYRGKPYWFRSIILQEKQNGNIVMSYEKTNNGTYPKKLNGLSGCGMWACHISRGKLQLAGIFIEHHKRGREGDVLYAVPIRELVELVQSIKNKVIIFSPPNNQAHDLTASLPRL